MTKFDNLAAGRFPVRRSRAALVRCLVLGCCALAGCAVGPDFAKPVLPAVAGFSPRPMPLSTTSAPIADGTAQRFVVEQAIKADWWTLFQSPALDALIDRAFKANPTIESATEALRVAQENVYAQQGLFFPTVQASYSPARTNAAGNQGGTAANVPAIYSLHTAQLTVGFVPDLFGANRRQVEALEAQARFQAWQLDAAYTTLAANVVAATIQEALLREQIAIAKETIDAAAQSVDLVRRQLKAGFASRLDLVLQQNALAQDEQLLVPLNKQLEQTRNLLRTLVGAMPDTALPARFDLASLRLPRDLPLSLPSQVVAQRPDVRAAEELLHAATAQVGIAKANRLPQFTIDASAGGTAGHVGEMFSSAGTFFNLAGTIAQPLFDAGMLKHRQRAAEEALRQADAQYRSTVLTAFQNVADTLYALHADADLLAKAVEGERAARASVELIHRQLVRGYVDRLAVINAEQNYRQAALSLAQARAARLGDTAALFQALGGGWWRAKEAPTNSELAVQ